MFRVTSKSQLVDYLSGVQIVLLAAAFFGFGWFVKAEVGEVTRTQIIESNQLVAEQIGRLLKSMAEAKITFGDSTWEKFQSIVEQTKLPNDGFLCIADANTGKLLCHPEMRQVPSLRFARLDGVSAVSSQNESVNLFHAAKQQAADSPLSPTGVVRKGDSTEVVSAAFLQNINGVLFVHQSEAVVKAAISNILTPVSYAGLAIGVVFIIVTTRLSTVIIRRFEHALVAINAGLEKTVAERTASLMKTRNSVIFGLAKLAESRDSDTGKHLERISWFSTRLAQVHAGRCAEIDEHCLTSIGLASSLHDIGKVGVSDRVLLKPGKLDADERKEIELHPQIGEKCLDAIEVQLGDDGFLSLAREICAFHHEKWDGTGYPYGKRGDEIPIAARLVALADVYDALRSRRPYKEPLSHTVACSIIAQGAGTHFDPAVVESFLQVQHEFESISAQYLSDKPELTDAEHSIAPAVDICPPVVSNLTVV